MTRTTTDGAAAAAGTVAAIVAAAAAVGPQCGRTTVIAIDGPAGSGKTSLAAALAPVLAARTIHMDDLYEGWSGLAAAGDRLTEEILAPIWLGRPGRYRRYDWHSEEFAESHEVPIADHLVVEGVGCVRASSRRFLSVIVWVEADDDVRLARGLARDGVAAEPHWRSWMSAERDLFARVGTRDLADVQVDAWGRLRP
ncbi:(d)CMP kinase [Occultella kanbiaonis]|uniref:(d)CMP kinase n=1 Tax=Occultella kanbiaonis TaxID=2675754 RepID=UPI0012B94C39|nr:(d)CMP kinase [Occultella kanbiaonis]